MIQDFTGDFELTPGQIWLNAASEGPLPRVSKDALINVVRLKMSPEQLTIPKFIETPVLLKRSLAALIHVHEEDIILGNSATYGMHLISHGLRLAPGDDVILMQNDFPTDILPWLHWKDQGVHVRQIRAEGPVLTVDEIKDAITPRTKVICLPMIHSFSGWCLDIGGIGALCRQKGITFVVNMSQVLGVWPVDISSLPVDVVVCAGYKWLLGPYGTGFCWIRPDLRESLQYEQSYWIALMDERSLNREEELSLRQNNSARKYDVFGTANFFNFVPWRSSIDYLMGIGLAVVKRHNDALISLFHQGVDLTLWDVVSPKGVGIVSPIIVIAHKDRERNVGIFEDLKNKGVHAALWKGNIRISPHIYNTRGDMERLLLLLNAQRE